ncbi:MAG: hypothetical protein KY433_01055 [Actinobacteria bacterium]|nr:hypothetical protein [Actinomycetota bacterium]
MEELDLERLVLPALLALLALGAFVIVATDGGIDPNTLRPGQTLKLAP